MQAEKPDYRVILASPLLDVKALNALNWECGGVGRVRAQSGLFNEILHQNEEDQGSNEIGDGCIRRFRLEPLQKDWLDFEEGSHKSTNDLEAL